MKQFNYEEIRREIRESPPDSTVYIGADSQVTKNKKIKQHRATYVTVIILHYGSKKGAKIFKAYETQPFYKGQLRMRLMYEVQLAIQAGLEIVDVIEDRGFEIHLDVNPNEKHKSNLIYKEAIGYVFGSLGIRPKTKPDSFAASSVADRFCHVRSS